MILHIEGDINRYYVQTLCMVFFPGASFPSFEQPGPGVPELSVSLTSEGEVFRACAEAAYEGRTARAEKERALSDPSSVERCGKQAVGEAVIAALGELMEYRPSWGILTGVRPAKVATELLKKGLSKTRVRKTLVMDYMVFPKKAVLATDVALNEQRIVGRPDPRDCSIYVSIPFCPTRCAYCSFVSYTSKRLLSLIPDYVDRLCADIVRICGEIRSYGLNVKTVYFGGGTPTVLEPEQIVRILSVLREGLGGAEPEEFTFESGRPDTITREKLDILRSFGVDRISVNPQTLCPEVLEGIGRHHTVDDFFRVYELASDAGIGTINTDLIAGLPGDNFTRFSQSVDGIIALHPGNVTVHTFCIKRSSQFRQTDNLYSMRGGDAGKCVDYSQIKLRQAGYIPYYMYRQKNTVGNYENVGFSVPGREGRYNIYMMEEIHSIIAVGAGAVAKFVRGDAADGAAIKRYYNPKYPYEYLSRGTCDGLIDAIRGFYSGFAGPAAEDCSNET
jgi:oxygen-independent coproporphyrinogen-3 oxidase